jgi:TrwC relaxase
VAFTAVFRVQSRRASGSRRCPSLGPQASARGCQVVAKQARDDGDDETAAALDAADGIEADLVESARLAVKQLEQEACYTRTGHHPAATGEWRDGKGLAAALFTHHISRDGDPQLHVHVAIANLVQRADEADGRWRSLDGQQLYAMKLSVAAAADRALESRLVRRGYAMVPRPDGNGAEVGGVSTEVMDLFSSRNRAPTAGTGNASWRSNRGRVDRAVLCRSAPCQLSLDSRPTIESAWLPWHAGRIWPHSDTQRRHLLCISE